ncbi:MAG: TolC family protein [Terriglobales bacterium]
MIVRKRVGALLVVLAAAGAAAAQAPAAKPLGLAQAVTTAWARYPGMTAARQAAVAAGAQADLARVAFWPNAGVTGQWDRATDNATLGLSFASPLPGISGTVPAADYSQSSAWTSAAGVYFSWEIADFGRRAANLRYFQELAREGSAAADLVRLQVGAHAADAWLNVRAAREEVRVTQADVSRWQGLENIVDALVAQQLRPGADRSRAQAELAAARIRASGATRDLAAAQATLAEALGLRPGEALPPLAGLPPAPPAPIVPSAAVPPQLRVRQDAVAAAGEEQEEIAREALPRWYVLASDYGRGSGVLAAGKLAHGLTGLAPTTAANWALGVGLDFSFTRWRATRSEAAAAKAQAAAERARQQQVEAQLEQARQLAAADWAAAQLVAQESPIGLAAAQTGEAQAKVRYQTGLASVADLENAEQLLTQADSDHALSQLQLWRALLETVFAAGSLQPLLAASGGH